MTRREILSGAALALDRGAWESAAKMLEQAAAQKMPRAMSLYFDDGKETIRTSFGDATNRSKFLIASMTKPMTARGVMWLVSQKKLALEDFVSRFVPEFRAGDRAKMRVRHLLTHTCGLPDMLPENTDLRKSNAPLEEYVRRALKTPLLFAPETRWSYSSTGILLAAEIARRVDGRPIAQLLDEEVFRPLGMRDTALGLGRFRLEETVRSQTEHAPVDLGGAPGTERWDWNSPYWRGLGAPWGGAHSTAEEVGRFLASFSRPGPFQTMIHNHNPVGLRPYGLGFAMGSYLSAKLPGEAFGHGGSTGTLCWVNPSKNRSFVLLTSLPDVVARKRIIQPVSEKLI